jgi:hypothetical protein
VTAQPHTSIGAGPIWAGLALIALATTAFHATAPTNHDVAWILDGAGRLLDGGRFGRDVVDVNPPLAWWLAAVPVAFARLTGGGFAVAAAMLPALLAFASAALADAAWSRGSLPTPSRRCLTFVTGAFLMIAPGYDYGQREHLMLIVALPYLAAASVRVEGRHLSQPLAATAGLVSAVGFCLKPWFFLIPLVTELWIGLKTRSLRSNFRTETIALVAVALGYGAALLAFAPDYVFSIVPDAEAGYWTYDSSFPVVTSNLALALLPSLIAAAILHRGLFGAIPASAQAMFLASVGACSAAFLQMKGWPYQLLPATGFAFIGCVALYCMLPAAARRRPLVVVAVTLRLVASFDASVRYAWQLALSRETVDRVQRLAAVFREYAGEGGPVFAFITSPRDIHPAVLASGARWVSSSCCVYLLPAGVRADEIAADKAARAREVAQRQVARVISLIVAEKPAVVIIDANREKLGFAGAAFDYLPYLLRNASFATFWNAYAEREPVGGYRIFVRSGGGQELASSRRAP